MNFSRELNYSTASENNKNIDMQLESMSEYICRLLNSVPSTRGDLHETKTTSFGSRDDTFMLKNSSISSSILSSTSSFDDESSRSPFNTYCYGNENQFPASFYDGDCMDEDNDSLCDEVINEIFSPDSNVGLSILGMI